MRCERSPHRAAALAFVALVGCASDVARDDGNGAVYAAWASRRGGILVTASGAVARIVDDGLRAPNEHEAFLLHLRGSAGRGLTVRVEGARTARLHFEPLAEGDDVVIRGVYRYERDGGVICAADLGASTIGTAVIQSSSVPILYKSTRASYTERIEGRCG